MKFVIYLVWSAIVVLALIGVISGADTIAYLNHDTIVAGFWYGLSHGLTFPAELLIRFFSSMPVSVYQIHNDGAGYNIGYGMGVISFLLTLWLAEEVF